MPQERSGYPADPPSAGASGGRTHPGCLPCLLSDGDAEAPVADACSRTDTTRGAGETGWHSNAGRIISDYRSPPPDYAALYRAEPGAGTLDSSPEPRPAAATTSAHHDCRLVSSFSSTQNVVETFGVPLLKTKRVPASDVPNCEGSVSSVSNAPGCSVLGLASRSESRTISANIGIVF